jgi:hypothetical protein
MIVPSDEDVSNVIGILGLEESDRAVIAAALQVGVPPVDIGYLLLRAYRTIKTSC